MRDRHKRSLVGSLIAVCLLLPAFAGCSKAKELAPALVLEKAYAATNEGVTSFRFTMSGAVTAEGIEEIDFSEGEGAYLAPDRMRWQTRFFTIEEQLLEHITISNKTYTKQSESYPWTVEELPQDSPQLATGFGGMVDPKQSLDFMKSPGENVTQLDDEAIEGVECWRYRRTIDALDVLDSFMGRIDKMIKNVEKVTNQEMTDPEIKEMVEAFQKMEMTLANDVWIGKEDYLVRQTRSVMFRNAVEDEVFGDITIPGGTRYTMTSTMKLSGFNEPVEIEAPFGPFE